ncbi:MAG: hypothetical protein IKQ91_06350 [Oscillospiraceae bacterium]|nr:hypothetical protein [Oscillospiraceae bacterium]
MKYIKPVFMALRKFIFGSLGIAVVVSIAVIAFAKDPMPVWKPVCVAVLVWLIIWILLLLMISSSMKKDEPLNEILAAKGYCDEWLQKHSEIYPNPDRSQKLRRADVLSFLGRYEEAKTILDSLSTLPMNDNQQFEYHNAQLDMLLTTAHYDEAAAYLDKCRKFMDIYSETNPMYGAVYACNAAVILALADDFDASEHYMKKAEQIFSTMKDHSLVMPKISRTMQLYALGFAEKAEAQEEETYKYIMNDPKLSEQWQKDHFLSVLGRAQSMLPEKRKEPQQ